MAQNNAESSTPAGTGAGPAPNPASTTASDDNKALNVAWDSLVQKSTSKGNFKAMQQGFNIGVPNMHVATSFFKELNDDIRKFNLENAQDQEKGVIPEGEYEAMYDKWMTNFNAAKTNNDAEAAWAAFDDAVGKFSAFNKQHRLPVDWTIIYGPVEQTFGARPASGTGTAGGSSGGTEGFQAFNQQHNLPEGWNVGAEPTEEAFRPNAPPKLEPEDETLSDVPSYAESETDYPDNITDLDELEENARKEHSLTDGEALYWWKRGVGSQVFVRYGRGPSATYRIQAGSNVDYDQTKVPQVLSSGEIKLSTETLPETMRGRAKLQLQSDIGTTKETWKYTRDNVRGIVGIGWKVDEDDEDGIEPLDLLWPEPYAIYPHIRALIQWKDGAVTLEEKSFISRIIKGSSLQKARVIYQKAQSQEIRYRKAEGIPHKHLLEDNSMPATTREDVEVELEEEEEEDTEFVDIQSSHRGSAHSASARPPSARPPSIRPRRSGTSQVRIVEPPRQPSTRANSSQGNIQPTRDSVPRTSVSKDEEIRWLREQVSMYESERRNYQPIAKPTMGRSYDDRRSEYSEYTPEPQTRQRRRRVQRQPVWDNWSGRWVSTRRVF
ncbi:hypothetical protein BDV29DRAFT_161036 [Aspergillus leporis]|uniref:Uncharacterized protein n=1 Tax=Aspergillus leporis TaxID=41062 RepID=A0A5N5WN09_9EURO|nr:hypothetical protein BDV29DRAFT_161036 [Aspergillus leporis]